VSYTVDNVGNRSSRTALPGNTSDSFTYDAIYQLTQVVQGGNTTENYAYDNVGNRTSSHLSASYTVNSSNQLTATSSATYTYDNNGNTLTKTDASGTTTYTWDHENRLTSVALPGGGGTVSFKYDPFGRRIQKSSPAGTINYVYDGANIVAEYDAGGTLQASYVQGAGIDQPLSMTRAAATSYYHADGLGSITSLTSNVGSIVATYTTDTFGRPLASTGTVVNPFRYTGREWDSEIGAYYYRARYYDAANGRFRSEDPIQFNAGVNF
jgi:RHS repeat-associated protein